MVPPRLIGQGGVVFYLVAIWSLLISSATAQTPAATAGLFIGLRGCLGVAEEQPLAVGDRLIVLAAGVAPIVVRVGAVEPPSDAEPCGDAFRADPPSRVASVSLPESLEYQEFFALRPREDLVILAGARISVSAADTQRLARVAAAPLPARWHATDVLTHAYRYDAPDGQYAVEVYLGLPTRNPHGEFPPLRSIEIRRAFVINGQVLASQQYERVSGEEERAETEPPQLTRDNWFDSATERTVAFLSQDDGRSWKRLSSNVGAEAINWIVEDVREGMPEAHRWYLYTLE